MIMDREEFEWQKAAIDWDEFYNDKKDYSGVLHGDLYSTFKKMQALLEECNEIDREEKEKLKQEQET